MRHSAAQSGCRVVLLGFQGFHRLSEFWLAPGLSSLVTGRWEGGERAFIRRVDYYCQGGQITSKIFSKRSERNQDKKKQIGHVDFICYWQLLLLHAYHLMKISSPSNLFL
jgi:hypothetical protein